MLFVLGLISCTEERDPSLFYNESEGYSIRFPSDWEIQDSGKSIIALLPKKSEDDVGRSSVFITVVDLPDGPREDDYLQQGIPILKESLPGFEFETKGPWNTHGKSALWARYSSRREGTVLEHLAYILNMNEKSYSIICTVPHQDFAEFRPVLDDLASTFKIR